MKKPLWLLIADSQNPDLPLVIPTLAWIAREAGAEFEIYLESERDGRLFARSGSMVLSGSHHQQFNYLQSAFEVSHILYGETALFDSSLRAFGARVLSRASDPLALYRDLLGERLAAHTVLFGPGPAVHLGEREVELGPYVYPEIFFPRALGLPFALAGTPGLPPQQTAVCVPPGMNLPSGVRVLDTLEPGDDLPSVTLRIARRWSHKARGVAFGDPAMMLASQASLCREDRVALYAPAACPPSAELETGFYTDGASSLAGETARLAAETGNRIIVGRQTCDGDILTWSRQGVCIQISDPNRPAFPVVAQAPHPWAKANATWLEGEPGDAQLRQWADEGRVLSTLLWHSGEVAHNEAMLALCELASWTGVKMGIGVHAQRYETAPQTWELIQTAREKGGVRGLIEPVLHSGGLGVLAEAHCPGEHLHTNIAAALERIEAVAGKEGRPRGYYAFLDTDLPTLGSLSPHAYAAAEANGLEYFLSSARPGRNRILCRKGDFVVLNQSCRVVHAASPFVRITHAADFETSSNTGAGWAIGTLDAPVKAFAPYIWQKGDLFMDIVQRITGHGWINVLPHTVARYARLLASRGRLPQSETLPD